MCQVGRETGEVIYHRKRCYFTHFEPGMKNKVKGFIGSVLLILIMVQASSLCFSQELSVPLLVDKGKSVDNKVYPLGAGVPFPEGLLKNEEAALLQVVSEKNEVIPSSIEIRSNWLDKSIEWIWIDLRGIPNQKYRLIKSDKKAVASAGGLTLTEDESSIQVNTGKLTVKFNKQKSTPVEVVAAGKSTIKGDGMGVYLIDHNSKAAVAAGVEANLGWKVETNNSQRAVIRVEGDYISEGKSVAKMILRYDFFKDSESFELEHRLIITQDTTKVWFKEYGITMPADFTKKKYYFGADNEAVVLVKDPGIKKERPAWIFQRDYPRWSINKTECNTGYGNEINGNLYDVADGWAECYSEENKTGVIFAVKNFAQTFPKELQVSEAGITAKLWSGRSGIPLDYNMSTRITHFLGERFIQETFWKKENHYTREGLIKGYSSNAEGTARTHKLICSYYSGAQDTKRSVIINNKLNAGPVVMADPKWLLSAGVFPKISAKNTEMFPEEEEYVSTAFDSLLSLSKDYPMHGWYSWGLPSGIKYGYRRALYGTWLNVTYHAKRFIPSGHRLSNIEGYNTTRNVWFLWVRSGERKYLDFLEKQDNALVDYRVASYGPEKGQINNWQVHAPVYWPGRLDYFNIEAFNNDDSLASLWMHYYLRDNRLAKEALENFTTAVRDHWYDELNNNIKPDELCQLMMSAWRVTKDINLTHKCYSIM
ncbi:MAG: exo-rhamnogalacturonan lyase family protein, partial [Planctomycetota bacterium]